MGGGADGGGVVDVFAGDFHVDDGDVMIHAGYNEDLLGWDRLVIGFM